MTHELIFTPRPLDEVIKWASGCHAATNHLYGDRPYSIHLDQAFGWANRYHHLLPAQTSFKWNGVRYPLKQNQLRQIIFKAVYCHDLIEDARISYSEVRNKIGRLGAEIVLAVTNLRGRDRNEKAGPEYYEGIRSIPGARFVKLCDRLANASFNRNNPSAPKHKIEMYRKEHNHFMNELWTPDFEPIWEELDRILFPEKHEAIR